MQSKSLSDQLPIHFNTLDSSTTQGYAVSHSNHSVCYAEHSWHSMFELENFNSSFILIKESNRILKQFQNGISAFDRNCFKTMCAIKGNEAQPHTYTHIHSLTHTYLNSIARLNDWCSRHFVLYVLLISFGSIECFANLVCKAAPQFIPRQRYKQQSCLCASLFNLIGSMRFDCSRHKSKSFKCSTWFYFHEESERERDVRFLNDEKAIHKISYRIENFLQVNG